MFRLPPIRLSPYLSRARQALESPFRYLHRYRRAAKAAGDALTRNRPVWMVSFALADTSLSEGLRAACAATSMLVVGDLLHRPDFAWAAIGAFWTCLADAAGTNRMRFASMAGFAVLSTVCGTLASLASGWGLLAGALAVLFFASGGALGRVWGAAVAQVTILSATACVVMIDRPSYRLDDALKLAGIYALGCLWATLLSATFWRIHPFEPSRTTIERAFNRLADVCRDCARLLEMDHADFGEWTRHGAHYRGEARSALEQARATLGRVAPSRSDLRELHANLLIALADAESVFSFLIGISDACERQQQSLGTRPRVIRTLLAIEVVLRASGREAASNVNARPETLHRRFASLSEQLSRALGEPLAPTSVEPYVDLQPPHADHKPMREALADTLSRAGIEARAKLSWNSISMRHAARCGIATTLGFLAVRALHLPYGYWATMAILLILQPSIGTTWPRSLERAAGSIVGGLIAALLGVLIHSPIVASIAVFPLIVATMALRPVSYSLFVLFLTPAFVLVAGFATPGAHDLVFAFERLANNVLGCVIAFAATFLLWPAREPDDFRERLAEALGTNLDFLACALARGHETQVVEPLRRAAGLSSIRAEASLQRSRLDALSHSGSHWLALTALALCRRVAGTAVRAQVRAAQGEIDQPASDWIAQGRERLVDAVLAGDTPRALPQVPASMRSQVGSEGLHQVALLATVIEQLTGEMGRSHAAAPTQSSVASSTEMK